MVLITTCISPVYRCIPEFVLENIVVLITMARRTVGAITEEADIAGLLQPALTLVITFMGDSGRTYNPHLRSVQLLLPFNNNMIHVIVICNLFQ